MPSHPATRVVPRLVRAAAAAFAALAAVALPTLVADPAAADTVCGPSAGYTLCVTTTGPTLSGESPVDVSVTPALVPGAPVARVEVVWKAAYLVYRYKKPYSFVWPTEHQPDTSGVLSARVVTNGVPGAWVRVPVTLDNGNGGVPARTPDDWQSRFAPRPVVGEPVVAAVGSGGAGKPAEQTVIDSIKAHSPNVFLYLGDVDEFGTWATYTNNYGVSALDDPLGVGTLWGSMAAWTAPTPGNHERAPYQSTWRDYWHQRMTYSTFTVADVRLYDLESNCGTADTCARSAEYAWLTKQLARNTEKCVIAYWHIPLVSQDYARNETNMSAFWPLLAGAGGDLVVNAHTHDMEETLPLDANLAAGQPGSHMVQLISGGAAGRWELQFAPDDRVAWELYHEAGALYLTTVHLAGGGEELHWRFENTAGVVLRSGSVTC